MCGQENEAAAETDKVEIAGQHIAGLRDEVQNLQQLLKNEKGHRANLQTTVQHLTSEQQRLVLEYRRDTEAQVNRAKMKLNGEISQLNATKQSVQEALQREVQTHQDKIGRLEEELIQSGSHAQALEEQLHKARMEGERLDQVVKDRQAEAQIQTGQLQGMEQQLHTAHQNQAHHRSSC